MTSHSTSSVPTDHAAHVTYATHAIVVAGGEGQRLRDSAPQDVAPLPPKPLLQDLADDAGSRLLDTVLEAAAQSTKRLGRRVVVAPPIDLPPGVERVRENPPLGGPAAALATGIAALADEPDQDCVLLLAGDLPHPQDAIGALVSAWEEASPTGEIDGVMAVAGERDQPLLTLLRLDAARRAFADVSGGAIMRPLKTLTLRRIPVETVVAADIDTWQDAQDHSFGVQQGPATWIAARERIAAAAREIYASRTQNAQLSTPHVGNILAADVTSPMPVPHYTSSAMDGFAVAGPGPWRLLAQPAHGSQGRNIHRSGGRVAVGEALPVLTGSLLPDGAETVVRSEHTTIKGDTLILAEGHSLTPGKDIRHAGEELTIDDLLAAAGTRLGARHLALLATCGVDMVSVLPPLTVDLAFTGNEVVSSGIPGPGEVRDAFSDSFPPLVEQLGATVQSVTRLADDPQEVSRWLNDSTADVVLVTGGSGHSGQDFARRFITAGADAVLASSVRCAPGHPTLVTIRRLASERIQLVIGVPGNPLAAHVALHSFVAPAIEVANGQAFPATESSWVTEDIAPFRRDSVRLMPAQVQHYSGRPGATGPSAMGPAAMGPGATPMTRTNSHMLSGYAHANALILVPPEGLTAGAATTYLPLD